MTFAFLISAVPHWAESYSRPELLITANSFSSYVDTIFRYMGGAISKHIVISSFTVDHIMPSIPYGRFQFLSLNGNEAELERVVLRKRCGDGMVIEEGCRIGRRLEGDWFAVRSSFPYYARCRIGLEKRASEHLKVCGLPMKWVKQYNQSSEINSWRVSAIADNRSKLPHLSRYLAYECCRFRYICGGYINKSALDRSEGLAIYSVRFYHSGHLLFVEAPKFSILSDVKSHDNSCDNCIGENPDSSPKTYTSRAFAIGGISFIFCVVVFGSGYVRAGKSRNAGFLVCCGWIIEAIGVGLFNLGVLALT
jgi:hypothetical protein